MVFTVYDEDGLAASYPVETWLNSLDGAVRFADSGSEFSLHFITDAEMQELNRTYRDKDEPTDVLTFALHDGEAFPQMGEADDLGDVFISLESMRRNAEAFGVDEEEELKRLIIHGLLHLSGRDHSTNDFSSEPMLIEQERLMTEMGWKRETSKQDLS